MSQQPESYWIGFDLGGTKMQVVIYDSRFQVRARKRRRTRGNDGAESGLTRIIALIEKAMEEAEIHKDQLAGIGIGCPGPVDPHTGIVHIAVNLGWEGTPVGPFLQQHFGCPVRVLNDVDAGVYGEYRFGAAKGSRCAVGIFPGTGIGGGCVYEDQILHGRDITCMEIGHTRVGGGSRTSGFQLAGTLEAEASRLTIAAEAAKAAFRGDAPNLLAAAGTDLSEIRSGVIAASIAAGDQTIKQLIVDAATTIGIAVVNIVHLLAPDTIVLGGGLVEAMPELIVDTVRSTARQHVLAPYRSRFDVVPAKLGDDAGSLGAAAWIARAVQRSESENAAPREKGKEKDREKDKEKEKGK
jgi:glucokinase